MLDRYGVRWIVSKYTIVSWRAGRIEIASSVSKNIFQTENPDILHVLHAFARAKLIEEVIPQIGGYSSEQIMACIDELINAGILRSTSGEEPASAHHWEPSALAFHRKSRQPELKLSPSHETPAVAAPRSLVLIPLDHPVLARRRNFVDVLESRRSRRAWPNQPIARETFSSLLWMSARNRDITTNSVGSSYVSRPYPSGGAMYSLELYPVIAPGSVKSIRPGVYRYRPESHALEAYSEEARTYVPFLEAAGRSAGSNPAPIVLLITSRFARQSEVYGDLAYSLVLKEVGALFQTLYLVAEYLELAGCALGCGSQDELLARLCRIKEIEEPVVGEFMIGPG